MKNLPDPKIEMDPAALPPVRIVLRIGSSRADLRQSLATEIFEEKDVGTAWAQFFWPVTDWVVSWILGLGQDVLVDEPKSLRKTISAMVGAMARTYANSEES